MNSYIMTLICKVEEPETQRNTMMYTKLFRYIPYCLTRLAKGVSERGGKIISISQSNNNNTMVVIIAYEAKEEVSEDWVNEHIPKD